MDRVTLKHYQDRAAKAQAIVDEIDLLLQSIETAKGASVIRVHGKYRIIDIDHRTTGQYPNDKRTRLLALLSNVFIDSSLDEIRRLEAELAAL
ncbi:hypothetical protein SAMN05216312_102187 [Cohnella sp. OV330]|uniref:hypothetical protein n=1 Tax=Cohnella sp. OV330 TaxID=1855288 RepID=UPI0008E2B140|nr:hypothetical protein [Cohnella sp. OV330]SFA91091.1 hypothetical protein SAMN05216312_102187 [Cohnella sp. OV330]